MVIGFVRATLRHIIRIKFECWARAHLLYGKSNSFKGYLDGVEWNGSYNIITIIEIGTKAREKERSERNVYKYVAFGKKTFNLVF